MLNVQRNLIAEICRSGQSWNYRWYRIKELIFPWQWYAKKDRLRIARLFIVGGLLKCAILFLALPAQAVPASKAINAIVGEAAGEGYQTMLGIACAIRNRGTLHGVYGYRAPHNKLESKQTWALARKAWKESAKHDITHGATHFDFIRNGEPYWASSMHKTIRIGDTQFYRR